MIARRRDAKPMVSSCQIPSPSGPRFRIVVAICRRTATSGRPPAVPAIPHMLLRILAVRGPLSARHALVFTAHACGDPRGVMPPVGERTAPVAKGRISVAASSKEVAQDAEEVDRCRTNDRQITDEIRRGMAARGLLVDEADDGDAERHALDGYPSVPADEELVDEQIRALVHAPRLRVRKALY